MKDMCEMKDRYAGGKSKETQMRENVMIFDEQIIYLTWNAVNLKKERNRLGLGMSCITICMKIKWQA